MAKLSEQIGFIRGLVSSMQLAPDSAEAKLYAALADALEGIDDSLGDMRDDLSELNDFVESIDEDLEDIEAAMDADENRIGLSGDDYDDEGEGALPPDAGLRVISSEQSAGSATPLAGSLCSECGKLFFVPLDELKEENELYMCPHCHKPVDFSPLSPENAPIAKPYRE